MTTARSEPEPAGPGGAPKRGFAVIRAALKAMPTAPGVYRMLDAKGRPLYVGKAKNLKNRVTAYGKAVGLPIRILRMIDQTRAIEIVTTHTEVEALLLEANLIKRLKPRYNIILRDDKSFPFIEINSDHAWPQLNKHRGARVAGRSYFGPFASAGAVNQTLNTLQRAFPLRTCTDAEFQARTRPCLQYQIKRCSAPCVAKIGADAYGRLVREARQFLAGRNSQVQAALARRMQAASDALDFETAALYRDRLAAMAQIQARQGINVAGLAEADILAAHQQAGQTCVQVFFFRAGHNYGNRAHFPSHARDQPAAEVLAAFISQFYDARKPPRTVLLSHPIDNQDLVAEALSVRAGRRVRLHAPRRGPKRELIQRAAENAAEALARRLGESTAQARLLDGVAKLFDLDARPERIEVYDNSHIGGAQAIGGMIVAGPDGLTKSAYRKFNIKSDDIRPGDDYGMLREVLTRRFTRLLKEHPEREDPGRWPDLVLIDGGTGQLGVAEAVLHELGVRDVALAAIAKGPDRNAGRERFFRPGRPPFTLAERDPVLYYLQRLRDEAHRFAIGGHRTRRAKNLTRSPLDEIRGIGSRRKKALLHRFGSAKGVAEAGLKDLASVDGISKTVARRVYDFFRDGT